jgi:transposase
VGGGRPSAGQHCDDEPGHPAPFPLDSQKKTIQAAERNETARTAFRDRIRRRPATDFVVVDEAGSNIDMTPRYGRAPAGQRAVGRAPWNTPRNTTLVASLTVAGMGPALTLSGGVNTAAFDTYVTECLVPTLRPGQIVVLDNLRVHYSEAAREAIEAAGCELWFLPGYSPDLSPIEEAFSKLKAQLRRAQARTVDTLVAAIGAALDAITPHDALGWFQHCGYPLKAQDL